jgi:hypothetical protein
VSHRSRDLNEKDIIFFTEYTNNVLRKGKRIFTEPIKKTKIKEIVYKKAGALKIN